MPIVAQIAVEKTTFYFDRLFTYLVPEEYSSTVQRGVRVLVPFGRGNRLLQGMVFSVTEAPETAKLKEIEAVLDETPILNEEGFQIVTFMAETVFCSYYDGVKCLIPAGLSVAARTEISPAKKPSKEDLAALPKEERQLLQAILSADTQNDVDYLFVGRKSAARRKIAESLIAQGYLKVENLLSRRIGDKMARMVRIAPGVEPESLSGTPKQREVLRILLDTGASTERDCAYYAGVTAGVVKNLVKKGVLEYFDQEVYRTPKHTVSSSFSLEELTLSETQEEVYRGIASLVQKREAAAALLFGVTGSGKTQIFIKLIQDCLRDGKQAMLLVPEISLTPQLLSKFRGLFGSDVAVLHSNLSLGERLDEYKRIKNGNARIVIGTRSSVFAPTDRLGLIIMDEEGEHSYRSDTTPRYHARDIAKLRCVHHGATLLLASATPSIESYYYAQTGRYRLFTLTERFGAAKLPVVELVDMKNEEQQYNFSPLSDIFSEALLRNYERGEQSIILLNRRGYATYGVCMNCGEGIKCPNCSITLTYHKANGYLMCHYCGHSQRENEPCGECGSTYVRLMGAGTQKIEDILEKQIPDARVLRMDADTTYSRYAYEEKFTRFEAGEYDIMVGTQMVAKGLNFPNVTLVGVLGADQYLYSSDYKSGEKTFSLVTQVVGRSGRYEKPGTAYIQTIAPENSVIQAAANQDYESFFQEEIAMRKAALQPPFCDLAVAGFAGVEEAETRTAAEGFYRILRELLLEQKELPAVLLGVSQASVFRVNGKYRYRIIVKCKNNRKFRDLLRQAVQLASEKGLFYKKNFYLDMNGEID